VPLRGTPTMKAAGGSTVLLCTTRPLPSADQRASSARGSDGEASSVQAQRKTISLSRER
jgi:hypothetical protein